MKEARLRRMKKEKTIPRPVTAAGSKHVLDRIRNMEFGVRNCRETEAVGAADRQPAVLPPAGGLQAPAAGGREREPAISAAVEKPEDQRKPERFFGNRKVDRCHPPSPALKDWLRVARRMADEGEAEPIAKYYYFLPHLSAALTSSPAGGGTGIDSPVLS